MWPITTTSKIVSVETIQNNFTEKLNFLVYVHLENIIGSAVKFHIN